MINSKKLLIICLAANFIFLSINRLNAQSDNTVGTLWLAFTIKYNIDDKFSIKNTSLTRYRDDGDGYHNSFHQPFINYKLNKEHALGVGYRGTWFEEVPDLHWILLEYKFNKALGEKFKVVNRLWYQHDIDHAEIEFRDFFRNHTTLHFVSNNKIKPYIGIEPWFQINGINEFNRLRTLVGFNWKLHENINLSVQYFNQRTFWVEPNFVQNALLVNLTATIFAKKQE